MAVAKMIPLGCYQYRSWEFWNRELKSPQSLPDCHSNGGSSQNTALAKLKGRDEQLEAAVQS
ncbi:hypothetical protein [Paenibacillus fonticola]|uniref:hypothetical protein n=1 Tax=Paenibacillus fonticola TaxID=379896 RepID=UPI0003756C65|nr:hypothetical protein [Paenibacillus fonticola]